MNAPHATLNFFAVLGLAGCATLQVRTDYDPQVSFTQLSTYDWGDREADASADPAVNSPLLERHIQDAVEGELGRMGYRKVTSDTPDFRIVYRVTADEKSRIDGSSGYGYYGYGSYGYGSHGYGSSGYRSGYGSYGYGGPYVYPRSSYRGSFGFSLYGGRYLRPFYGYPGAGYGYAGTGRVREYLRGTLVLDVIDVRTDEVVFRGSATKSLHLDPDPEKVRMYVSEAVEKILKDFPSARSSGQLVAAP